MCKRSNESPVAAESFVVTKSSYVIQTSVNTQRPVFRIDLSDVMIVLRPTPTNCTSLKLRGFIL